MNLVITVLGDGSFIWKSLETKPMLEGPLTHIIVREVAVRQQTNETITIEDAAS